MENKKRVRTIPCSTGGRRIRKKGFKIKKIGLRIFFGSNKCFGSNKFTKKSVGSAKK